MHKIAHNRMSFARCIWYYKNTYKYLHFKNVPFSDSCMFKMSTFFKNVSHKICVFSKFHFLDFPALLLQFHKTSCSTEDPGHVIVQDDESKKAGTTITNLGHGHSPTKHEQIVEAIRNVGASRLYVNLRDFWLNPRENWGTIRRTSWFC